MIAVQAVLAAAALVVSFVFPWLGDGFFTKVEDRFRAIANRRGLSVALVALLALVARVAALPIESVPHPHVDDEFGYLLAADTFAHGRLTNPTPPMWEHFETFSEIMRPTYQCFAQPAQGLVLALGQILGHPFIGVLLGVAAMSAAICWMLQAWVSPTWALVGGLISIAQFGVFSYWADSYWGGAVPACAGALVLGALPRITENSSARDAVITGVGLGALANSRPYEGLVFSLPVAAALLAWSIKKHREEFTRVIRHVVVPLALTLCVFGLATTYYCWRVTGSPFKMPYQVNRETVASAPYFIWQSPHPPSSYANDAFRDFYANFELNSYRETRSLSGLTKTWMTRTSVDFWFYLGPILILPILAALAAAPYGMRWRDLNASIRFLLITLLVFMAGIALEAFHHSHYTSPATCVVLALVTFALAYAATWTPAGRPVGRALARMLPVAALLTVPGYALLLAAHYVPAWELKNVHYPWLLAPLPSEAVKTQLLSLEGNQLILVRYAADPRGMWTGWVENSAGIDKQKIVWAWDLGLEKNRELINYYRDRRTWLVDTSRGSPTTMPYTMAVAGTHHE